MSQEGSLWQEIKALINASKGSPEAKARDKLGCLLILFGLLGVPILLVLILLVAALFV